MPTAPAHVPAASAPAPQVRAAGPRAAIFKSALATPGLAAPRLTMVPPARSYDAPAVASRHSIQPADSLGFTPEPQSSVAPSAAAAGTGAPMFFAIFMSLLMLAAIGLSKLRIAPALWGSVAIVSSIERPG
jgi:hypothetical protein